MDEAAQDIRREDVRLLRGAGTYGDDIVPKDALHAVFVRSPHAAAEIAAIDVTAARAITGVCAVVTGAEIAAAGLGAITPLVRRPAPRGGEMWVPPRLPLAVDRVRYVGDAVALVVGRTRHLAEDAAEAVEVAWRDGPSVTDIERAVEENAPQVWDDVAGNVAFDWHLGDRQATDAAFAVAAHATELTIRVSRTTASPLEPRTACADFDAATGRYRLTAGVQAPWQVRGKLAEVLGIEPDRLEIVVPDVGGSFGMKGQTFAEYGALLFAARLLGRPICWRLSRSEAMLTDDQGRDVVMTGALALDTEGRIAAVKVDGLTALGAYLSTRGTLTAVDNLPGVCGPYRVPAAHARMRGIHTHTPSISPYRGAGRPEASLLIERLIDEAAFETGCDPVALRKLNMYRPGDLPATNALGFIYDKGDFAAVLDRVIAASQPQAFTARRAASVGRGRLRGRGVASVVARSANGQFEMARATLIGDERVRLDTGAVSQGQGHDSVLPGLAARILGIDSAKVELVTGSSDLFDAAVGTFGSRTAAIAGPAVEAAARALRARLVAEAGRQLNVDPAEIRCGCGTFSSGSGRAISFAALAERAGAPIAAEARYTPNAATFPNGAHVCEVEIDRETGVAEVAAYWVVEDVGSILNKAVVVGQVHGGIAQGLAQGLNERIAFDAETGQPLTGSFMDFALPRAADMPAFQVASHPVPTEVNPLGAKGAGEGGTVGALPALQNALADALRPFGVRDVPMPATSERLWRLMQGGGAGTPERSTP